MLLDYNKKELEELGKLYGMKGVYKLNKKELVDALTTLIPINMSSVLEMLEIEQLELFEELIGKDKPIPEQEDVLNYYDLIALGLVNVLEIKGRERLTVDNAIKESYKKLDSSVIKKKAKANHIIRTHILGLLNLYGALEIDWACELYNRYQTDVLTEKDLIDFTKKDRELSARSRVSDNYIAEETIYSVEDDNLYDFIELTKNKPYYVPTKEYIELFSNELYYDNTLPIQKLRSYIKKNLVQDEELIEDAVLAVVMIARVDCDRSGNTVNLMLEEWANIGIEIRDLAQANEALKHIVAVVNTTRKWINKGYTPQELSPNIMPNTKRPNVTKLDVGRNNLCPCGSGKKFKKCCGKSE